MLLTKNDFEIGQVVACKHVGNRARYNRGMTLGKVIRISSMYITVAFREDDTKGIKFTLEKSHERDYLIEKSNYSADYEMYPSEKSYLDHEEKEVKLSEIRETVGAYSNKNDKLTIDQVRRIYDIIIE